MKDRLEKTITFTGAALSLALYGCFIRRGLRTPPPGEDQDVSGDLPVELHEFPTADGVTLRVKRYAKPGGTPVLLCHGFGGCGTSFDLPREDRNMAVFLARQGLDVWVSSWRGCGREPYASGCGDWTHTIDDLAVYDAVALVDGVAGATGGKVVWVGHSMGGHILYMYLQGVRFEGGRVVSDPGLVRSHHRKLLGGVTLGSPPGFAYRRGEPYHTAFKSATGTALLGFMNRQMLRKEVTSPRIPCLADAVDFLEGHPRLAMALSRSPLASLTYCRRNTDKDATTSLVKWGTGPVSAGMYVQLLSSVLEERFREHPGRGEPGELYDYTAGMALVELPIMFLTGTEDFANPRTIRRLGYEAVSSQVKEYVNLEGYGHTDLLMGKGAVAEVYPRINAWIRSLEGGPPPTPGAIHRRDCPC